jgi:uncharacterized protein
MFQEWAQDRRFKALVFIVLGLAAIGIVAYVYLAYTQAKYMGRGISTISVQGTSDRSVTPDVATFTFSVMAEDVDANAAQQKSATSMQSITDYLKAQGVAPEDIKTVYYNLYPRYEYTGSECNEWGYCSPGGQRVVGYTADESISVKIHDITKAAELIAGVGSNGATNISGLSFTIDDPDALKEEIRAEAIADAREKADRLAESLGVRLGKLSYFYEEQPYPPYNYGYGGMMMEKSADASMSAPSIAPGQNEITSTVTLTYEIK